MSENNIAEQYPVAPLNDDSGSDSTVENMDDEEVVQMGVANAIFKNKARRDSDGDNNGNDEESFGDIR